MKMEQMNIRLLQKLDNFAEVLTEHLEKRKLWVLCGVSILYLGLTCLIASRKLMWFDELFTYYIATLPHVSDIWSALLAGEPNPPLLYLTTRASFALFGINHISIRLPEVLGFWVMSLCLFQFVSTRSSALYGFVAMLFPLVTGAGHYATEARSYALILGFSGLSLLCWQAAAEGYARKRALTGLAVSLAAAVSSHYYAILLFVPLVIGEGVRSRSLRRLDLPIWLSFSAAMTPLLLFLPLIARAKTFSATFWAKPSWGQCFTFYMGFLAPSLVPLVPVFILLVLYSMSDPTTARRQTQVSGPPLPWYEIAAAFGFMAIPVVAVLLAQLVTGAFTPRYALPSGIGFSILLAAAAASVPAGRALIGVALVLSVCGAFVGKELSYYRSDLVPASLVPMSTSKFLQSEREHDLPIVASDSFTFMELGHYAPRELAARLVYLADPGLSLHYLDDDSDDRALLALKPWFPFKIERYGPYMASQRRFLVYGSLGGNWLLSELIAADMRIELRGRNANKLLFLISPKDSINLGHVSSSYE
jgi:hypothetical protein